jgi:outer membrane autotransporter protein
LELSDHRRRWRRSLYGSYDLGKFFLDGSLTYGKNNNESKRSVAGTTAEADYDSELLGLNARAGYTYQLNPEMVLEPQVGARYTNIETDSYSEKGSSAALSVNSQRFEIGDVGFGARLAGSHVLGKGVLRPEGTVMFWHDVIGDSANTTSSFLLGGNAFTTNGATAARNSIESSLGLKYSVGQWTVGASYDQLIRTDFSAKSYGLNARYDF